MHYLIRARQHALGGDSPTTNRRESDWPECVALYAARRWPFQTGRGAFRKTRVELHEETAKMAEDGSFQEIPVGPGSLAGDFSRFGAGGDGAVHGPGELRRLCSRRRSESLAFRRAVNRDKRPWQSVGKGRQHTRRWLSLLGPAVFAKSAASLRRSRGAGEQCHRQ